MKTCRQAKRDVAHLSKRTRALERKVKAANADVRAAVDSHSRAFVGQVRENAKLRAESFIRQAQRLSDEYMRANSDLVNARAYAASCSRRR